MCNNRKEPGVRASYHFYCEILFYLVFVLVGKRECYENKVINILHPHFASLAFSESFISCEYLSAAAKKFQVTALNC